MIQIKEMQSDYKFPLLVKIVGREYIYLIVGANSEAASINISSGEVTHYGKIDLFGENSKGLYKILHNGSSFSITNETLKEKKL